eukprot:12825981-Ditylum_brightwellii.AAC.1
MKNLYIMLQFVEVVALLCVLSIHHILITTPVRWLAGNTNVLADFGVGLADMCTTAFAKIINDSLLSFDDDFMMNIFKDLVDKRDPLNKHLKYIFEEKQSCAQSIKGEDHMVLSWDELQASIFYPTCNDMCQTEDLCCEMTTVIANTMRREFQDERKATSQYLSSLNRSKSAAVISEEERKAGL